MNNLLRTLTESRLPHLTAPETNLKLLLNDVKEARRQTHDTKVSDAFYESLEGLLHDLRTVTMDNHDAEPFLKPVVRSDYPDYYDIIEQPMDLQTMLKKAKQKHYKSKREFKDDLDLIWSNCFLYNATENHPLRQYATRLKVKAEKLLANITDRKERTDPVIPPELSDVTTKPNGLTNGINGIGKARRVSFAQGNQARPVYAAQKTVRRDAPFPESLAITRTAEDMAAFMRLDAEVEGWSDGQLQSSLILEEDLREYAVVGEDNAEVDDGHLFAREGEVGEKRKLASGADGRPRKRPRTIQLPKNVVDLWWDAMRSDALIGSGLPVLRHSHSEPSNSIPSPSITDPPRKAGAQSRKKRKKQVTSSQQQDTLLYHMNNNIKTLRRLRITHAKFTALKEANEDANASSSVPFELPPPPVEDVEDVLDEQPWMVEGSGLDVGEKNANDCLHWMDSKILEHVGFQGTSKAALDVLAGVTSDYLLNVGRTMRFMCDKYGNKMTPEEIILHTLFESGVTRVYELERYIKDDVLRHGNRLSELEKKVANAYAEATSTEAWDDEALFREEEDEEQDGEFVTGNFAESFGEDFLGLRELGIAEEFGLSSLTIPKKLLRGKNKAKTGAAAAKPSEPPPPFPPPPSFVPLDSKLVEDQIGLLKPFYQQRLSTLSTTTAPSTMPPSLSGLSLSSTFPPPSDMANPIVIPDDVPTVAHTKMGPLGQITKSSSAAANAAKKKAKAKGPTAPGSAPPNSGAGTSALPDGDAGMGVAPDTPSVVGTPMTGGPDTPRKPRASAKKKKAVDMLPPVIIASA